MKTIITATQVVKLAFGGDELVHSALITECDIAEAEERYIRPIVGSQLYDALVQGKYPDLMTDYVAPALAAWCRYVVEPLIARRCSLCDSKVATDDEYRATVLDHLASRASTLSRRLSRHLNAHSSEYEEYNPKSNPLNRCTIYGNIIQIH